MASRSYYEAIAQVIPILLLAITIGEGRVHLRETLSPRSAILGALFIGAVLLAGEMAALRALKVGHGSNIAEFFTALAIAIGFALVIHYLGRVVLRDVTGLNSDEAPGSLTVILDGAMILVALTVFVVLIV